MVEAISDFWEYFAVEQQYMPRNCSKDLTLVADHIDSVFATGTAADITSLKTSFGLETVEHPADFAE